MRFKYLGLVFCLCLTVWGGSAEAQGYRVYTRVSLQETAGENAEKTVIGRSLTIWHAGKIYDYMPSVGELVV